MEGVTGLVASLMSSPRAEWEWGSMMPGVRYLPVASMMVAEAGALVEALEAEISAILPAWIQTLPLGMVPWEAVMTVAFLMRMSVGACAWAAAHVRSAATAAAARYGEDESCKERLRVEWSWNAGIPGGYHDVVAPPVRNAGSFA
jgi:hypothetical protein